MAPYTVVEQRAIDENLLKRAESRFRNCLNAMKTLQQVSKPPSIPLDPSDTKISTVLEIFAVFASTLRGPGNDATGTASAAIRIRSYWQSLFGPWVRYLLERLVLPEEGPSSVDGVLALEQILVVIPDLLAFPSYDGHGKGDLEMVVSSTPYLLSCFMRVWIRAIETNHGTWGVWSSIMAKVARSALKGQQVQHSGWDLDRTETEIGLAVVRHLNREIPRISKMSHGDFIFLKEFITSISVLWPADEHPLIHPSVAEYSIPTMVSLLAGLTRKRDSTWDEPSLADGWAIPDETKPSFQMIYGASGTLGLLCAQGPFYVSQILKAGFLKVIFWAHPNVYRSSIGHPSMAHDTMIEEPWDKILAGISSLLMYPSTLHQFMKAVRSLIKLDRESLETSEDMLRSNSDKVWTRWMQTKA
ncbi:hypothetical protein PQX77_004498 [Marasmius sp. AFHP31]|nr:hypothetical protein PQX77_004498 [Marasmius sp. AFHP31]